MGRLRQIKARFADALEKKGPRYEWSEYNKDFDAYENLRDHLRQVGSRFSASVSSPAPYEPIENGAKREVIQLSNAVTLFISQTIAHVNAEAPRLVEDAIREQMTTSQPKVLALQTDHATRLFAFAMIAFEMREAKACLPGEAYRLLEPLTLTSIRQASPEVGEAFVQDAKHFLVGYDTAVIHSVNPVFGVAAYFNRILASELGLTFSGDEDNYLGVAVSETIRRLRIDWWKNLSDRVTVLVT